MSEASDRGLAPLQRGDYSVAAELFERACRFNPSDFVAHQYLAAAYQSLGRGQEAVNAQIMAVTLQPSSAQARYNLGVILERGGFSREASEALHQALHLQPDYPQAAEALARVSRSVAASTAPDIYPNSHPAPAAPAHGGYELPDVQLQSRLPDSSVPHSTYAPTPTVFQGPAASPYAAPYPSAYPTQPRAPQSPAGYGWQAPPTPAPICQMCGASGPVRSVSYHQVIGMVVLYFRRRIGGLMCEPCASKYFWEYSLLTVFVGWLGLISLILSPFFLIANVISYAYGAPNSASKWLSIGLLVLYFSPVIILITMMIVSITHG